MWTVAVLPMQRSRTKSGCQAQRCLTISIVLTHHAPQGVVARHGVPPSADGGGGLDGVDVDVGQHPDEQLDWERGDVRSGALLSRLDRVLLVQEVGERALVGGLLIARLVVAVTDD